MKIICTKEEFAEMLEVCTHRVDDGECSSCLLYASCGGEKGIVKLCVVSNEGNLYRSDLPKTKSERPRLVFDGEE